MKQVTLPGTTVVVSQIALGTWGLGGPRTINGVPLGWPRVEPNEAQRILEVALDLGISMFDTADFYGDGEAERVLGRVLPGRPHVAVASKGGLLGRLVPGRLEPDRDFSPAHLGRALEATLHRLGRDWIDVYQLHGPPLALLYSDEPWRSLDRWREQGRIRCVGVSLNMAGRDHLAAWLQHLSIASVQLAYSVADPEGVRHVDTVINRAKAGRLILARSVLAHGLLFRDPPASDDDHRTTKIDHAFRTRRERFLNSLPPGVAPDEAALRVALGSRSIDITIVGASRASQVARMVEIAGTDPPPGLGERVLLAMLNG